MATSFKKTYGTGYRIPITTKKGLDKKNLKQEITLYL